MSLKQFSRSPLALIAGLWLLLLTLVMPASWAAGSNQYAQPGTIPDDGFYVGIQKVTPEELYEVLPDIKGKAVFLEFKSKFCLACKKMDPILEEILPQYPNVETRIYDMMKDREKHAAVFNLFQPAVVPIQLYINPEGEVVNVFYDEHTRGELESALQCIDPSRDGTACLVLAKKDAGTEASWEKDFEKQVNQSLASGSLMIIVLAFIAGIASSFFPCTVAMLPVLVGYMGGYSGGSKKDIFLQVTMFVLGLATVMTVLGVGLSLLGATFGSQNSNLLYYAVGGLCIVMALQMMELVHIPLPQTIKTLPETQQGKLTTFYVLGCAFGLVASPCGTPVLAAILGVIGKEGNVLLGGTSLFSYALGQGALLMVAGLFTGLLKHRATFMKVGTALTKVSGVLILLVGASFILQAAGLWSPLLKALNLGE